MRRTLLLATTLLLLVSASASRAQNLISAFEGSELVGEFSMDFVELQILTDSDGKELGTDSLEGRLQARLLRKPETKSSLELFRSYERELEAGGFETLLALKNGERNVKNTLWNMFRVGARFTDRPYRVNGKVTSTTDKGFLFTFTEWYLLARKLTEEGTIHVAIMISREKNLYAIDVLRSAAMETDTVELNAEFLRFELAESGKVAIYDIHFDSNSAQIRPESESALAIIAQVLQEHAQRSFFVVGHTDGTGDLDHNVSLSMQRANAVVEALSARHGIDAGRLTPRGVGPLAPVGSNESEGGRTQNRRVELVVRL